MRGWLYLGSAVAVEIGATSLLPATEGFTRPSVTLVVLAGYGLALFLLSHALRTIPLSITYALWSGLGTAAIAVVGVVLLDERLTVTKVLGTALVVAGVLVLELGGERPARAAPTPDDGRRSALGR